MYYHNSNVLQFLHRRVKLERSTPEYLKQELETFSEYGQLLNFSRYCDPLRGVGVSLIFCFYYARLRSSSKGGHLI